MDWNTIYKDAPRITAANSLYQNVLHGRGRYFKAMLDRGVDINSKNDFGENVLIAALKIKDSSKRRKVFKYLLRHGADIHFKDDKHERGVLLWVCYLGRDKELHTLLDEAGHELDLKVKDKEGNTALHYATKANSLKMVQSLVEISNHYRESVDIPDNQGFTPYILARRLGYRAIANVLHKEGNASKAQFDSKSFRSCREWSVYGKWERTEDDHQRQMRQMVLDKINGDYKHNGDMSSRSSNNSSDENDRALPNLKTLSLHDVNHYDQLDCGPYKHRRSSLAAMSLLGMTSLDRGRLVRSFHHSEFDTSKKAEYKDVFKNVTAILEVLSQQNSTSFRETVKQTPPLVQVSSPETNPTKSNVSSLAIIMGQKKNALQRKRKVRATKPKASRVNCGNGVQKSKMKSVSTSLPNIQMNNKVV